MKIQFIKSCTNVLIFEADIKDCKYFGARFDVTKATKKNLFKALSQRFDDISHSEISKFSIVLDLEEGDFSFYMDGYYSRDLKSCHLTWGSYIINGHKRKILRVRLRSSYCYREGAGSNFWSTVFPDRSERLKKLMLLRNTVFRRLSIVYGRAEDEVDLERLWRDVTPRIAVMAKSGAIIADRRIDNYPKYAELVVRDTSTRLRHHISIPVRFVNPCSLAFATSTEEERIKSAVAWTFGKLPDQYFPSLEA